MRKIILRAFLCTLVLFNAFTSARSAFAHGDEPRLEISVERINPGGTVELRGVDFDYDQLVTLSLIGTNLEIPLNDVTSDVEGVFTQLVVLPTDLPTGDYYFRANTDHEEVMSSTLTVWGTAVEVQESNGIQDQSDVQLEPLPTSINDVATQAPQAEVPAINATDQNTPNLLPWFAGAIGIILVAGFLLRRKR